MPRKIAICENGIDVTFRIREDGIVELERFAPAAMTEETAESQAGSRAECEENQTENQQENPAEVYPILEVNVTGKSTRDMHGYRHNAGSASCDFRYQSHQVTEQAGGKELVIDLKTDSDVWAHYHMRFYDGVPVVRVYSVLENRGTERHAVEYISSFVYQNLCGDGEKPYYDKTDVWIPFNSWSCEARWKKEDLSDLNLTGMMVDGYNNPGFGCNRFAYTGHR